MTDSYEIDSIAYLNRARKWLNQETNEGVFYAAFELRCGTESRLQQYLDARNDIARHRKQGWKIIGSTRELDKRIRLGDAIYEARLQNDKGDFIFLYHIPITARLGESAGARLHDLLHAMKKYYSCDDQWWNDTRKFLEEIYSDLKFVSRGTLLAPIMLSRDGKSAHMSAFLRKGSPIADKVPLFSQQGNVITFDVRYLKSLPDHAEPFLNRLEE